MAVALFGGFSGQVCAKPTVLGLPLIATTCISWLTSKTNSEHVLPLDQCVSTTLTRKGYSLRGVCKMDWDGRLAKRTAYYMGKFDRVSVSCEVLDGRRGES